LASNKFVPCPQGFPISKSTCASKKFAPFHPLNPM
jgi:hypothetical protein